MAMVATKCYHKEQHFLIKLPRGNFNVKRGNWPLEVKISESKEIHPGVKLASNGKDLHEVMYYFKFSLMGEGKVTRKSSHTLRNKFLILQQTQTIFSQKKFST